MSRKKNSYFFKHFDEIQIGSIPRVILSSFVLMIFFYSAPFLVDFSNLNRAEIIKSFELKEELL